MSKKKTREEGSYLIKRVERLPKNGNANILYALSSSRIDTLHRWMPNNTYEAINIGKENIDSYIDTVVLEGDQLVFTSKGSGFKGFVDLSSLGGGGGGIVEPTYALGYRDLGGNVDNGIGANISGTVLVGTVGVGKIVLTNGSADYTGIGTNFLDEDNLNSLFYNDEFTIILPDGTYRYVQNSDSTSATTGTIDDISSDEAYGTSQGAEWNGPTGEYTFYPYFIPRFVGENNANCVATGEYSILENVFNSFFSGENIKANGVTDVAAFGANHTINSLADYSVIGGNQNTVNGSNSVYIGNLIEATGRWTAGFGRNQDIDGYYGLVAGDGNTVNGHYSLVTGVGNTVHAYGETLVGTYNTINTTGSFSDLSKNTNRAFGVGNGVSGGASTAFEVFRDGRIVAPDLTNSLIDGASDQVLITKGYLEANSGGTTPDLLAVLTEGNSAAANIIITGDRNSIRSTDSDFVGSISPGDVRAENTTSNQSVSFDAKGTKAAIQFADGSPDGAIRVEATNPINAAYVQTLQAATGTIALLSDVSTDGLVPYTGATANVDLGTNRLTATGGYFAEDTTYLLSNQLRIENELILTTQFTDRANIQSNVPIFNIHQNSLAGVMNFNLDNFLGSEHLGIQIDGSQPSRDVITRLFYGSGGGSSENFERLSTSSTGVAITGVATSTATTTQIGAAGNTALVTKEYGDANYLGVSGFTYVNNVVTIAGDQANPVTFNFGGEGGQFDIGSGSGLPTRVAILDIDAPSGTGTARLFATSGQNTTTTSTLPPRNGTVAHEALQVVNISTLTHTLADGNALNAIYVMTNTGNKTFNIPSNGAYNPEIGTQIQIINDNASSGTLEIAAPTGAILRVNIDGATPLVQDAYQKRTVTKIGTNTWLVSV